MVLGRTDDDDDGEKPNPGLKIVCDKNLLYFQLTYNLYMLNIK